MKQQYEIRIRFAGDDREWREIEAMTTKPQEASAVSDWCKSSADKLRGCVEIRFNAVGSQQGYYVRPTKTPASVRRGAFRRVVAIR